jgi:energy-coupling factor transport system permease protein
VYRSLYLNLRTPIHDRDPRTKILGSLVLSALPFVFNDPRYVAVIAAIVLGLSVLGGSTRNLVRLRYVYLLFFVVTFALWQVYITTGATVVRLGPVRLTHDGLLYGLAAALRFIVVMMVGALFVSCTTTEDLTVGLLKLRLPYPVAFVISTTVRLVPTFIGAAGMMVEAQTARGMRVDSRNPVKRARQLLPVTIPLIMFALRHASLMSLALEARGFSPVARRTSYSDPLLRGLDVAVLVALAVGLAGSLALRLTGHGAVLPDRV